MRRSATRSGGAVAGGRRMPGWDLAAAFRLASVLSLFFGRGDLIAADGARPLVAYPGAVARGIYLLGGLAPSAAYAIETSEGIVLVDSGLQDDAGPLKAQLEHLGLDWKAVRAILITHAHIDHSGGAEHLRVAARARVFAGQGDAAVLRAGAPHEAFFSAFSLPGGRLHPTRVDVELRGGETLTFGDVRIRALATPGHTPGSVCYLMERDGQRALFSGDVISMLVGDEKSPNRVARALGTYSAYLPPRYRGDARSYLASLRELRALPVPDLVLPGHPRGDPTPESPALSQGRWEEILDRGIAEMATLQARYEADGADFLDGVPKQLLPDLYYLGDRGEAAIYGFFASSRFILVDAPGGPGLLGFVRDRLRGLGREPADPAIILLTSCDQAATSGLGDLLAGCRPTVVAAPAGLPALRKSCPEGTNLVPADRWPGVAGLEWATTLLRGRGIAPAAYRIRWAGKRVLFSGRIAFRVRPETEGPLLAEISASRDQTLDYLFSLYRLGESPPDLWLPATPVEGQNADLYDAEWRDILADHYRVGYRGLEGR